MRAKKKTSSSLSSSSSSCRRDAARYLFATLACVLSCIIDRARANYPVIRFRNGTVGVRSSAGGEVHVQSDEFLVNGDVRVSGSVYVNDTDLKEFDNRAANVENVLGIDSESLSSCENGVATHSAADMPNALTHWIDFSRSYYSSKFQSGATLNSAYDIMNNASVAVFGDVEYVHDVQFGNGAAFFNDVIGERGVSFSSSKLGKNPEIIIAYNQIGYMEKGVILGDHSSEDPSYIFGTKGSGTNNVGMRSDKNANMGKVEANYNMWHVADVYYGDSDGFLKIDNDENAYTSFSINNKYNVESMSEPRVGGVNSDTGHMHGYVGEVLYFNQKLSAADRERAMSYMMGKWIDGSSSSESAAQCSTTYNTDGSIATSPSDVVNSIAESIKRLTPMACEPPGGARLYFDGANFVCECNEYYVGESCTMKENLLSWSSLGTSLVDAVHQMEIETLDGTSVQYDASENAIVANGWTGSLDFSSLRTNRAGGVEVRYEVYAPANDGWWYTITLGEDGDSETGDNFSWLHKSITGGKVCAHVPWGGTDSCVEGKTFADYTNRWVQLGMKRPAGENQVIYYIDGEEVIDYKPSNDITSHGVLSKLYVFSQPWDDPYKTHTAETGVKIRNIEIRWD